MACVTTPDAQALLAQRIAMSLAEVRHDDEKAKRSVRLAFALAMLAFVSALALGLQQKIDGDYEAFFARTEHSVETAQLSIAELESCMGEMQSEQDPNACAGEVSRSRFAADAAGRAGSDRPPINTWVGVGVICLVALMAVAIGGLVLQGDRLVRATGHALHAERVKLLELEAAAPGSSRPTPRHRLRPRPVRP